MNERTNSDMSCKEAKDLKIIIVGDTFTGKTSIIERFMNNTFSEKNATTISPEFQTKVINSNNIIIRIHFWDLPGQDRNYALTQLFCKDSNGIILCCDVSNENSRENLTKWNDAIKNIYDIKNIPKIILENKCDLLKDEEHYNDNIESLREISNELNNINFFRVSALNGYNIKESIDYLINECIKRKEEIDIEKYNSFSIKRPKIKDKEQKRHEGCC